MIIFPPPLFKVDYISKGRGHLYPVTLPDGTKVGPFKSVTRIQSILNKPLLVNWAKKEALKRAREEILKFIDSGKVMNITALDALLEQAKKEPDRLKDAAADVGTRTHDAIDVWISGDMPDLTPDVKPGFDNFTRWLEGEKIRIVRGDTNLASVELGVGGRADAYGEKDNKLILIDFKTGKALYDDTIIQIGGYDLLTKATYGLQVDRAVVLRIGKEIPGDFEPKWVNLEAGRTAFMGALDLSKAMDNKQMWVPSC